MTSATGMIAIRFHKKMTSEEKSLANWLRDQRRHIKKKAYVYLKNWVDKKKMDINRDFKKPEKNSTWLILLLNELKLKVYSNKYGNCNVPRTYNSNST